MVISSDDCISFPITDFAFLFNNQWSLIDGDSIFDLSSTAMRSCSFGVFFMFVSEIQIEFTAAFLIRVDVAINRLMADTLQSIQYHPSTDLFRTPPFLDILANIIDVLFGLALLFLKPLSDNVASCLAVCSS